jgi:RNA polymerase sigma-70 factor, ECF subfamily
MKAPGVLPRVDPSDGNPGDSGAPSERSLEDLMDAYCKQGDRRAFDELFTRLAPKVNILLLRLSRNRELAEELTQVTFLKVHRARDTYAPGSKVFSWVMAIARNVYIDAYRKNRVLRRHELLTLEGEIPEPGRDSSTVDLGALEALSDEDQQRIQATIDALPDTQREALMLLKVEGLSLKQAAEITGASVTAVKVRAFRAYEALRAAMGVPKVPQPKTPKSPTRPP